MKKRIIITDSGLGGINIMSSAFNKFCQTGQFSEVELIFFNSLPNENFGYNQLPDMNTKSEIFGKALLSIQNNFNPDLILIACNTLSVVYKYIDNETVKNMLIKGIVDEGIKMIYDSLNINKNSSVLIIGTPTTINSNAHKLGLSTLNISQERIFSKSCYMLESIIQNDPNSLEVMKKIDEYLSDSLVLLDKSRKLLLALCCTHYEYSLNLFKNYLIEHWFNFEILNPNEYLLNNIFDNEESEKIYECKISVRVVSKTKIIEKDINSLSKIIEIKCKEVAEALRNYEHIPDIF